MNKLVFAGLTVEVTGQDMSVSGNASVERMQEGVKKMSKHLGIDEHAKHLDKLFDTHSDSIKDFFQEFGIDDIIQNHGNTFANLWNSHGRKILGGKNFGKVFKKLPSEIVENGVKMTNIVSELANHPVGVEHFIDFEEGRMHGENIHDLLVRHELDHHIEHLGGAHHIANKISTVVGAEQGGFRSFMPGFEDGVYEISEQAIHDFVDHHNIRDHKYHDLFEQYGGAAKVSDVFNDHVLKVADHFYNERHVDGVMQVINSLREHEIGNSVIDRLHKAGLDKVKNVVSHASDGNMDGVFHGMSAFFLDPSTGHIIGVHGQPKISEEIYVNPQEFNPSLEMHNNLVRMLKESENAAGNHEVLKRQIDELYAVYGDHTGHYGTSAGFDIKFEPSQVVITSNVDSQDIQVNFVQNTLIIQDGSALHRSFNMPSNIEKAGTTVVHSQGTLTITIPRDISKPSKIEGSDNFAGDDYVSPAVKAMHESLEGFKIDIGRILKSTGGIRNKLAGRNRKEGVDLVQQMLDKLDEYHGPEGSYALPHPAPHKNRVNETQSVFVGCVDESSLPADKVTAPASVSEQSADFNVVYGHYADDIMKPDYVAIARHGAPLNTGNIFTFKGEFKSNTDGKCGTICRDDSTKYCGCSSRADFQNPDCKDGQTKFAVYQIVDREVPDMVQSQIDTASDSETNWRLATDSNNQQVLDIVVPYQANTYEVEEGLMVIMANSNPISKVHLPIEVQDKQCAFLATGNRGPKVIRCPIPEGKVQTLAINREEF